MNLTAYDKDNKALFKRRVSNRGQAVRELFYSAYAWRVEYIIFKGIKYTKDEFKKWGELCAS